MYHGGLRYMARRRRRVPSQALPTSPSRPVRSTTLPGTAPFRWQAAGLFVLALLAFWNSLDASFHFDDWALFNDPYVAGPGAGLGLFRLGQTRPLTYWSFHLNFLARGAAPFGYHLVNMLLHAVNTVLVLWIARRHAPPLGAFLAAGLFAVHPLQTEAVTYVFARSSLLATLFALLCFLLFLRGRYGWSLAAFAVSLLAKEETVALPALLLLYDYLFTAGGARRALARRWWYYAALAACSVLAGARLFYVLQALPQAGMGFRVKGVSPLSYALTQARVIWHYLRLVVLPIGQNLDYDFLPSTSLLDPPTTLPAVLALAGALLGLVWLIRANRGRAWAFWALGFFLLLAPSSSIVAQSDLLFEHRTYFPMVSLVVALGGLAGRALEGIPERALRLALVAALLGTCTVATIVRNRVWATELSLWRDVVSKSPNKGRPYIGLARGLAADNQPVAARRALERGLRADPHNPELLTSLGVALLQEGDSRGALERFERALALERETPELWNNIGAARYRLQDYQKAIEAYQQALALDTCFYNSRRNLMMTLSEMGRKKEALEAGTLPAGCRIPTDQARELEQFRSEVEGR